MSLLKRELLTSPVLDSGGDCLRIGHEIEGSTAGEQTDYQIGITTYYGERTFDIATVALNNYGTVLVTSPGETDSLYVGCGDIVKKDGILYMIYMGCNATGVAGALWTPHLATSTDGINWTKHGQLFGAPPGSQKATPYCIFFEDGVYYLFFGVVDDGESAGSETGYHLWCATSTNLTDWTIIGHVVDNQDIGLTHSITNPSVIKVGDYYYMTVAHWIAAGKFKIRMLRSESLTSGYSDMVAINPIIDPDAPQHAWYNAGAWDCKIFKYGDQYVILFGARDATQFRNYGFAYTTDIEGAWTVLAAPFYTVIRIGGRSSIYFDGELLKIYVDRGTPNFDILYFYDSLGVDNVYLNEKCREDFADIRFRQGTTELDFWMKEKTDGNYAIFWVKVPTIPADPDSATIYIYYGKAGVTTTPSSIYDPFIFGDDFEECDLARWTINDTAPGVSACQSDQSFDGNYSFRGSDTSAGAGVARIYKTFTARNSVRVWGALRVPTPPAGENVTDMALLYSNGTLRLRWRNYDGDLQYYTGGAWVSVFVGAVNTWYQYLLNYKQIDAITWNFDLYFYNAAGVLLGSVTDIATMDSMGSVNKIQLQVTYTAGVFPGFEYAWQDITRVGEFCDPEPTHGIWGSEEGAVWPF